MKIHETRLADHLSLPSALRHRVRETGRPCQIPPRILIGTDYPDAPAAPGLQSKARVIETGYRDVFGDLKARFGLDANRGLHEQLGLQISCVPQNRALHTRAIDCVKSAMAYPDPMKGRLPFAVEAVRELGRNEKVGVALSTGPSVTSLLSLPQFVKSLSTLQGGQYKGQSE